MPPTELQARILALVDAKRPAAREKEGTDPGYRKWINTLPCLVCSVAVYGVCWIFSPEAALLFESAGPGSRRIAECAHVGVRGLGTKCDDRETVPLCPRHHRTAPDAHHVLGKWFWLYHDLDRERIIAELQRRGPG